MRSLSFGMMLLSLVAGCARGNVKVSGQVRYNGAPLPGGIVTFQPADTKFNTVAVLLDEQGNYEATLPPGKVQVAIDNRDLQPSSTAAAPSAGLPPEVGKALSKVKAAEPPPAPSKGENSSTPPKSRGKYVAIPEKYYSIEKSGLSFTVEPGNPKHDIELK